MSNHPYNLTPAQLTEIYTLVAERRTRNLKHIDLEDTAHSLIPSELLDRAKLNLSVTILN